MPAPNSLTLVHKRMLIFPLAGLTTPRCADGILLLRTQPPAGIKLGGKQGRFAEGAAYTVFGVVRFVFLHSTGLPEPPWHAFN